MTAKKITTLEELRGFLLKNHKKRKKPVNLHQVLNELQDINAIGKIHLEKKKYESIHIVPSCSRKNKERVALVHYNKIGLESNSWIVDFLEVVNIKFKLFTTYYIWV